MLLVVLRLLLPAAALQRTLSFPSRMLMESFLAPTVLRPTFMPSISSAISFGVSDSLDLTSSVIPLLGLIFAR